MEFNIFPVPTWFPFRFCRFRPPSKNTVGVLATLSAPRCECVYLVPLNTLGCLPGHNPSFPVIGSGSMWPWSAWRDDCEWMNEWMNEYILPLCFLVNDKKILYTWLNQCLLRLHFLMKDYKETVTNLCKLHLVILDKFYGQLIHKPISLSLIITLYRKSQSQWDIWQLVSSSLITFVRWVMVCRKTSMFCIRWRPLSSTSSENHKLLLHLKNPSLHLI